MVMRIEQPSATPLPQATRGRKSGDHAAMPVTVDVYFGGDQLWHWRLAPSLGGPAFARGTAKGRDSAHTAAVRKLLEFRRLTWLDAMLPG